MIAAVIMISFADFAENVVAATNSDDSSQIVDVGRTVVDGESYDVMVPVESGETVNSAWKSRMLAEATRKLKKSRVGNGINELLSLNVSHINGVTILNWELKTLLVL